MKPVTWATRATTSTASKTQTRRSRTDISAAALRRRSRHGLPYLNYGVIQLVHDGGNGAYHALSLKLTRRFGEGLSIVSSYTFAKSIDDTSGIRTQGFDTLFPQNSDCIRCERGLSSFDVRHRSVTSILYDLPIGKGKPLNIDNRVLNAVAGGWQAGGIITMQTGVPGTLSIGGVDNAATSDGGYDRPNSTSQRLCRQPDALAVAESRRVHRSASGLFRQRGTRHHQGPGILASTWKFTSNSACRTGKSQAAVPPGGIQRLNHPNWGCQASTFCQGPRFPANPAPMRTRILGLSAARKPPCGSFNGLKYSF